jgi:hypothetical protein
LPNLADQSVSIVGILLDGGRVQFTRLGVILPLERLGCRGVERLLNIAGELLGYGRDTGQKEKQNASSSDTVRHPHWDLSNGCSSQGEWRQFG